MNTLQQLAKHNEDLIKEVVSTCLLALDNRSAPQLLLAYGSLVLGTMTSLSDIDLLVVVDEQARPERKSLVVKSRPVTLYSISYEDLLADAEEFRFGGYFVGKMLNPHMALYDRHGTAEADITYVLRTFFSTLTDHQPGDLQDSPDSLEAFTKSIFKEYMEIHPHYACYVTKLYTHQRFPEIWNAIQRTFQPAYQQLRHNAERRARSKKPNEIKQANLEIAMRFWKTGIELHNNNIAFPELYFSKCNDQASANREAFQQFLEFINQ